MKKAATLLVTKAQTKYLYLICLVIGLGAFLLPASVLADSSSTSSSSSTSGSSAQNSVNAQQAADLANIIAKGDQEITRRLNSLNNLDSIIASAKYLTSSDQSTLTSEVNTEIAGLTQLKTELDSDTTLAAARDDAQSIVNEYRVYALVFPKVWLVKTADDQQNTESLLKSFATVLQTRISSASSSGSSVTSLKTLLSDLNSKVSAAQIISSGIEAKVLPLQPTNYDSDHSILSGDYTQLQTAHSDCSAAYQDAKNIVNGLQNL